MLYCLLLASSCESSEPMLRLDQRIRTNAASYLSSTRETMVAKGRCSVCFMHASLCVCPVARRISARHMLDMQFPRFECRVLMHYKELGRPSNSGKFLPMLVPQRTGISVYGTEDCLETVQLMTENNAVLLFPERDSIELNRDTLLRLFPENNKTNVLCVLDSTWSEAKTMNKWVPRSIPRVHLPELSLGENEGVYCVRKRARLGSEKTALSTIEALGRSLDIIHDSSKFHDAFLEMLKYSVDAVFKQRGYQQVFGHTIQPNIGKASLYDAFTKAKIQRPKECPVCKQTSRFKNLGSAFVPPDDGTAAEISLRRWRCKDCGLVFVSSSIPA